MLTGLRRKFPVANWDAIELRRLPAELWRLLELE
jgi:hypothetical protein